MSAPIAFYGLLFVADNAERQANLPRRLGIDAYVACAVNCARSFRHFGESYTLVSNVPEWVEARAKALGYEAPQLAQMEFSRDVPIDFGFASAHRKLEVIEQFGSGKWGERCALVDLDTELVRPFPTTLETSEAIRALDITPIMETEFGGRVAEALQVVRGGGIAAPRWFGGEFLAARAEQFEAISELIAECWDRYLAQPENVIHQGDEVLSSVALSILAERGCEVSDAGCEGIVARYWSARTRVPMPRFADIANAALMHLPADKPFLAERAGRKPDPAHFAADYRAAVTGKLAVRSAASAIDRLRSKRTRLYAPRW